MEYTNENALSLGLRNTKKQERNNKFIKKISEHSWFSMVIISLVLLSSINIIMIYNFFKILQNI